MKNTKKNSEPLMLEATVAAYAESVYYSHSPKKNAEERGSYTFPSYSDEFLVNHDISFLIK